MAECAHTTLHFLTESEPSNVTVSALATSRKRTFHRSAYAREPPESDCCKALPEDLGRLRHLRPGKGRGL